MMIRSKVSKIDITIKITNQTVLSEICFMCLKNCRRLLGRKCIWFFFYFSNDFLKQTKILRLILILVFYFVLLFLFYDVFVIYRSL